MKIDPHQHKHLAALLTFALLSLAGMLCGTAVAQSAPTSQFITIDAPDAVLGTEAQFINQRGSVTGLYYDASQFRHGFYLPAGGTLVEFDPPSGSDSIPTAINRFDQIVGLTTINQKFVSFLRSASGHYLILSFPGATDTRALGINDSKQITGWYTDASNVSHGYIREPDGSVTVFDEPDAATLGTYAQAINNSGVVTGYYFDAQQNVHGFVRDAAGNFTSFDAPGATGSTAGNAINDNGSIIGFYGDPFDILGSYERDSQGNFKNISVPGSNLAVVFGINNLDMVVGEAGTNSSQVAFRRNAGGNYSALSIPVPHTTSWGQAVNDSGAITGFYQDPSFKYHGFLIKP